MVISQDLVHQVATLKRLLEHTCYQAIMAIDTCHNGPRSPCRPMLLSLSDKGGSTEVVLEHVTRDDGACMSDWFAVRASLATCLKTFVCNLT